ncbi:hypothetical protein DDB_G0268852 [Dictyostelium discoideum AX4]|uniref:Sacsin/Nov domain-containing protein n=1 Tax=Dictyostelium discoideum TaxID=44689 RepID=Q55EK4_DICDI|nr:hypothetical protein DDB_G0268852 [Dictyostelium discoideum AX4]EAL73015.1 hypothetical protein DDB_G0268852 [Dictyostelium discoideum AX4]|eukprot:XP_647016.1 hypothetical protein DDB_G0268852 [Dictyostelium discoideum AX4]
MPKTKDQRLKVSHSLRNNLLNYPESKIVRELIQNAEDALADTFIIKVDEGSYPNNGLLISNDNQEIESSKELLGPSILIYNNATFHEQDWEGICEINQGSKKENLKSVGNFGLGWNSVYHITDNPIVYSGNNVWFADPNERIGGGLFFDLDDEDDYNKCFSFLEPFIQFKESNCNPKEYFNGTIIRLPLRIYPSEIKKAVLTMDAIKKILNEFSKDINEILIFLKSLASITIIVNNQIVNSVKIKNYSKIKDQREKVSLFLSKIVDNEMNNPSSAVELAEILCSNKSQSNCESTFQIDLEIYRNGVSQLISYLVSQGIYIDRKLIELVKKNKEIKLISYGGVAVPISLDSSINFKGKPFTFLPIGALVYDIPLHVNGYFRLSNARDNIIYSLTEVEEASESLSKQWNKFISETIIPYFYVKSLEYLKSNYLVKLYNYFPYKCNNENYQGQSPAYDISITTMKSIIGGKYFLNYFNSHEYLPLIGSLIISSSDIPPDFVLTIIRERNIKTIFLSNELLNHFNNLRISLLCYSKQYLCSLLVSSPLKQYSEDVINYICCTEIIEGGHLNMVNILPTNSNNITLDCLKSTQTLPYFPCQNYHSNFGSHINFGMGHSYININQFLYMSDQVYDLLFRYHGQSLTFHLKISTMPPNFRKFISAICRKYWNIGEIKLSNFLTSLKSLSNKFLKEHIITVWGCIDELGINETLELSKIRSIPIVPYRSSPTQTDVTSYDKSSLLMYRSKLLPIEPILNKLNIYIIEEEHQFNNLLHATAYISKLLNYLKNVDLSLDSDEIDKLRIFLVESIHQASIADISIFYNLPIHPCIGNSDQKFSSITNNSICVDYEKIDQYEIKGLKLIKVNELSKYKRIVDYIPTKQILIGEKQVYRYYLIQNISSFELNVSIEIITEFLTLYGNHYINDGALRKFKFIPSENDVYSTPDSFYVLSQLERDLIRNFEPSKILNQSLDGLTGYLSKFGLKFKPSDKHICSKVIDFLSNQDSIETYQTFMDYLNQRGENIGDSLIDSFKDIPFIPSSEFDTYDGFGSNESKISLSECALSSYKDCLFTVKTPIKVIKNYKNPINKYLSSNLNDNIIQHLINLNSMEFNDETSFDPNIIFNNTYKRIDDLIKTSKLNDEQKKKISQIQLIWLDGQLVPKEKIFYNSPNPNLDFKPYFFITKPTQEHLFKFLKLKEIPDLNDFIRLIKSIQDTYDKESSNSIDLFELVIYSLQNPAFNKELLIDSKIKLPTTDNQFVEFEKVIYIDHSCLPQEFIDLGHSALHNKISENTASKLSITKLSQLIQSQVAFENSFGQKEELVDRLKQILRDYKVEVFLNEMVQNAHDAGSTEVKLILDCNSLKQQFLKENPEISTLCKDLPSYFESSLLFYNNSVFTEKDIKNVQVMSASIKKQDENSIGQHGLGINSMYSFSDCPCILSGEYLMIFDPFVTHIGQSINYSHGAKYKISEYKTFLKYFKPFQHLQSILGFDLDDGKFNGTIIRLPLRKTLNDDRFISPQKWNEVNVLDYLKRVKASNLENLMFFTNIDSLEVSILPVGSKKLEQQISIHKESSLSLITNQYNNLMNIPTQASEYTFTIIPSEKSKITEKYIIGQVIEEDFKDLSEYPDNKALKFLSIYNNEKRKPVGGVAFKLIDFSLPEYNFTPKSFCFLPYKDLISNIPVHIHANFSTTSSRDILENVKSSNLYNIEEILSKKDNQVIQTDSLQLCWNQLIVTEIIAPLYINTLTLFKNKYIKGNDIDIISKYHDFYYSRFPVLSDSLSNHSILEMLANKFYSLLDSDVFIHYPGVEIKKNHKDTFYAELSFLSNSCSVSILKCISHIGFNVKVIPFKIFFSFKSLPNWLTEYTISMALKGEDLNPQVINTQDIANLILYLSKMPEYLDNCQVLIFNDKTRDFLNIENKIINQLYNQTHYEMTQDVLDLKFIDRELTDIIKMLLDPLILDSLKTINIFDFNYVDFYFHYLLPNFNILSAEKNISFLNKLLECFTFEKNSDFKSINHPLISKERIKILKGSKVFPFVKNGIREFTLISKLFNPTFKQHDFILDYPDLYHSKENIEIFRYLGIRDKLKKNDIVNQFKKISSEVYSENTPLSILIERARLLWKSEKCVKVFNELLELNIVPVKESNIIGSRKISLGLMPTTEVCQHRYEDLYFSVKLLQDVDIKYPPGYNQIDCEKIFENFVNLLTNIRDWKLIQVNGNLVTDPKIIQMLISMCSHLENYTGNFSSELVERIQRIPVLNSTISIEFTNIVMGTDANNLKPFFNILPPNFSTFRHFFSKIGVIELNLNTIVMGLNRFLHDEINTTEGIRSLNYLYELLFSFGRELETFKNEHSPLPVFTKKGFIKPSNQVYLFDGVPIKRINTTSFYEIHDSIRDNYEQLGVLQLSSVLREELDNELTNLENEDLENSIGKFLNTLIKENQEFISRVNHLQLSGILNITVKTGYIRTKFIFNRKDITKTSKTKCFYDHLNSTLYIGIEKGITISKAFKYLFNSTGLNVNPSMVSNLKREFVNDEPTDDNLFLTLNVVNFVDVNQTKIQKNQCRHYNTIALRNFQLADTLLNNQSFIREASYHYYVSTEMSMRSLLVFNYNDIPYAFSITRLRGLLSRISITTETIPQIPDLYNNYRHTHLKNEEINRRELLRFRSISNQLLNISNQKLNENI